MLFTLQYNWILSLCISVELEVFQGAHTVLESVNIWLTGLKVFGFGEFFAALQLLQMFRAKSLKYYQIWVVGLNSDAVQA